MIGCGYVSRVSIPWPCESFEWYINYESSVIVMYLGEWGGGGGVFVLLERW